MKKEIWQKFLKWGSGWEIEAERNYNKKREPLYFRLKMFGLHYPKNYELAGYNLEELLKQAIKDGKKSVRNFEAIEKYKTLFRKKLKKIKLILSKN